MAKPKPTICQVLHSLEVGGAEVLAARLARHLGREYRFLFACLDDLGTLGRQLRDEGFQVQILGRRPGWDWECSKRLAAWVRKQQVDVLHAHQYTPFFYSATARLLCRRPSILFTEHGRWFPDYPRRKRMVANRLLLEPRDRVVGVGHSVRRALIDNEGIAAERVDVIYNGIDVSAFQNGVTRHAAARREMGVGADDFVIIQVARLDALKNHQTAIRTFEQVVRRRRDARLVLVGDGPELAAIEESVRARKLESSVRLLGLRPDVPALLAGADVFLLTSLSEGIPLTVIEAMLAALPVVSTRVGGVAEIVEDGTTGMLAAAEDDAALAEHVLRLADDPALRKQMGERGRQRALAMFTEDQMHTGYRRLYEEMADG